MCVCVCLEERERERETGQGKQTEAKRQTWRGDWEYEFPKYFDMIFTERN